MWLYYVSENDTISSNYLSEGSWAHDQHFGTYRTAVDTRSLSISLFPFANDSSALGPKENTTTNVALLFFENPNGNVSALLYRLNWTVYDDYADGWGLQDQWINITSQDSKALPEEFHNAPWFNSYTSYTLFGENAIHSRTLYESGPNVVYNTPFFSASNFLGSVGAMFYSPFNVALNASLGDYSFISAGYTIGLNGSGNFSSSIEGEHYARPYTERSFCEITSILGFTLSLEDRVSIRQSDIAVFGNQSWGAIWINGTQPVLMSFGSFPQPMLPSNEFPFKRLASVTSTDGSATYLYHQMNGTTFAEEQWDDKTGIWLRTEYITVSYP